MNFAVTGTRYGANQYQQDELADLLCLFFKLPGKHEFHHGDCIGVDAHVHDYVALFHKDVHIVIHPPENNSCRAFKNGDETRKVAEYIRRNHLMVDECEVVIVVPRQQHAPASLRGQGTWATYNYAHKTGRECYVIRPHKG